MPATALALYGLPTRYNELSYLCKKYAREHQDTCHDFTPTYEKFNNDNKTALIHTQLAYNLILFPCLLSFTREPKMVKGLCRIATNMIYIYQGWNLCNGPTPYHAPLYGSNKQSSTLLDLRNNPRCKLRKNILIVTFARTHMTQRQYGRHV